MTLTCRQDRPLEKCYLSIRSNFLSSEKCNRLLSGTMLVCPTLIEKMDPSLASAAGVFCPIVLLLAVLTSCQSYHCHRTEHVDALCAGAVWEPLHCLPILAHRHAFAGVWAQGLPSHLRQGQHLPRQLVLAVPDPENLLRQKLDRDGTCNLELFTNAIPVREPPNSTSFQKYLSAI